MENSAFRAQRPLWADLDCDAIYGPDHPKWPACVEVLRQDGKDATGWQQIYFGTVLSAITRVTDVAQVLAQWMVLEVLCITACQARAWGLGTTFGLGDTSSQLLHFHADLCNPRSKVLKLLVPCFNSVSAIAPDMLEAMAARLREVAALIAVPLYMRHRLRRNARVCAAIAARMRYLDAQRHTAPAIAIQRAWRRQAYRPGKGCMYKRALKEWSALDE